MNNLKETDKNAMEERLKKIKYRCSVDTLNEIKGYINNNMLHNAESLISDVERGVDLIDNKYSNQLSYLRERMFQFSYESQPLCIEQVREVKRYFKLIRDNVDIISPKLIELCIEEIKSIFSKNEINK